MPLHSTEYFLSCLLLVPTDEQFPGFFLVLPGKNEFLLENEGGFRAGHHPQLVGVAKIEKAFAADESLVPDDGAGLHFANLLVDPSELPAHQLFDVLQRSREWGTNRQGGIRANYKRDRSALGSKYFVDSDLIHTDEMRVL